MGTHNGPEDDTDNGGQIESWKISGRLGRRTRNKLREKGRNRNKWLLWCWTSIVFKYFLEEEVKISIQLSVKIFFLFLSILMDMYIIHVLD